MSKLLTIDDLAQPGWQDALPSAAWLGDLYEEFKKHDTQRRHIEFDIGGDEERAYGIHASEICGCLRKVVYSLTREEQRNSPEHSDTNMRRRMQQGSAVHGLVQSDFDRMCWLTDGRVEFQHEVRIAPELYPLAQQYEIHSSTDGIFTLFANHEPFLRVGLEIKTMSDKEYEKLRKPLDYHLEQAHVYMKLLNVPLMWFFYYNKSNSNWTAPKVPFLVAFDHRIWDKLEHRMQQAHALARAHTLPERQEGMPCRWCSYSWKCLPTILQRKQSMGRKPPPRPGEFRR